MKILIMGLSGSGKTTLAKKLAQALNAVHLNVDDIRKEFNDWDFSKEGRERQCLRMRDLAEKQDLSRIVIVDFICPTPDLRWLFNADFTIFMNTVKKCKYDDTNEMFVPPENPNVIINAFNQTEGLWFNEMVKFIKGRL